MATPVRVVFRLMLAEPMRRASDKEKAEMSERWNKIRDEWKQDPGIKFCSYYWTPGRSLDGFSHHYLFEVEDVSKVMEMNKPFGSGAFGPFEKYSFEVVWGNPEADSFWAS